MVYLRLLREETEMHKTTLAGFGAVAFTAATAVVVPYLAIKFQ